MKSQYDQWVDTEKDKIHKDFEQKRQELLEKSFLDGLTHPNQKSQGNANYERLQKEEENAIQEFMKNINNQ